MSERAGIEIDYCPNRRGVWLDRGEFDRIIERVAEHEPHVAVKADEDGLHDRHDDGKHGRRRKRSMLGELFEFGD
jgi:uncharacterized protein